MQAGELVNCSPAAFFKNISWEGDAAGATHVEVQLQLLKAANFRTWSQVDWVQVLVEQTRRDHGFWRPCTEKSGGVSGS